jgi:hypothetical protein
LAFGGLSRTAQRAHAVDGGIEGLAHPSGRERGRVAKYDRARHLADGLADTHR